MRVQDHGKKSLSPIRLTFSFMPRTVKKRYLEMLEVPVEGQDTASIPFGYGGNDRIGKGHSDSALTQSAKEFPGLLPVISNNFDKGENAEEFGEGLAFPAVFDPLEQLGKDRAGKDGQILFDCPGDRVADRSGLVAEKVDPGRGIDDDLIHGAVPEALAGAIPANCQ